MVTKQLCGNWLQSLCTLQSLKSEIKHRESRWSSVYWQVPFHKFIPTLNVDLPFFQFDIIISLYAFRYRILFADKFEAYDSKELLLLTFFNISMEGNFSSGNMISGPGGSFDLQNSMRPHHQQHNNPFTLHQHQYHNPRSSRQQIHPLIHENFPLRMGTIQDCDCHTQTISLADFTKGERGKSSVSDERWL
ncbi:hypothetical protein LXL04_038187 [Taraxacum kok-saghyz]